MNGAPKDAFSRLEFCSQSGPVYNPSNSRCDCYWYWSKTRTSLPPQHDNILPVLFHEEYVSDSIHCNTDVGHKHTQTIHHRLLTSLPLAPLNLQHHGDDQGHDVGQDESQYEN